MTQATLVTERLELVPPAGEHLELEVELDSDPEVLRRLFPRAQTRAEVKGTIATSPRQSCAPLVSPAVGGEPDDHQAIIANQS
jgi:hypothetical protein